MKTALVTGATDGIGHETAVQLARHGLRVLVHGRNESRAGAAAAAMADRVGGADLTPVWADLSRMEEVARLADQISARIAPLDVLVNNAGVYLKRREVTPDGFEMTMAVNHLAPFLLTCRLLPIIEAAPAARIVTVSSMTHEGADIDPDDFVLATKWDGYAAYATSKLANVLFTRALSDRLPAHVTANALHPGVIGTKLLRAGFGMGGRSVEDGARTSVYLATAPAVEGVTGGYFVDCRARRAGRAGRDSALAERLWRASESALKPYL